MKVLVAGSNGNTGKRIVRLLVERGHEVRAMVRDEDQMSRASSSSGRSRCSRTSKETWSPR